MSTLTLFQGFCVFVHFFAFKNTLEKLTKWTLQWKVLVHPSVHSPATKAKA
jgi:quinolinate synthase